MCLHVYVCKVLHKCSPLCGLSCFPLGSWYFGGLRRCPLGLGGNKDELLWLGPSHGCSICAAWRKPALGVVCYPPRSAEEWWCSYLVPLCPPASSCSQCSRPPSSSPSHSPSWALRKKTKLRNAAVRTWSWREYAKQKCVCDSLIIDSCSCRTSFSNTSCLRLAVVSDKPTSFSNY